MPGPFRRTTQTAPGGTLVTLSGIIDETFDGSEVFAGAAGLLAIDLDGVTRITSFGVRRWIQAMRALQGLPYIGVVRARPPLVAQFNMVRNFGGSGQLISFYAPWRCPSCAHEFERLLDLRDSWAEVKSLALPETRCPRCDAAATLDELPDEYLAYAAGEPQPGPPPTFEALAPSPPTSRLQAFTVRKQVTDALTVLWLSGPLTSATRFKRLDDGLEGQVLVCAGEVQRVGPEGLEALVRLLGTEGVAIALARVPSSLATALRARPGGPAVGRVVSVMLPFRCQRCGLRAVREVGPGWLEALAKARPDRPSCSCGGVLRATFSADELRAARALRLVEPTSEVSVFLATHRTEAGGAASARATSGEQFGRYQLVRPIGLGGMAEVSLARQTGIGGFEKKLVVKRILPQLSVDPTFVSMFLQEARLAARISHPNVVQIFDVGEVDGRYFIAMEYVHGWDLAAVRRACRELVIPMPVELVAFALARICAGLHAAHSCVDDAGRAQPIIHRDVSPHNALVSTDGQVKLTDFGIAKAFGVGAVTPTTTVKGKLSYMSPEQVRSDAVVDPRSDIFSVGVMLYELVTLEHLFRRDNEYATCQAILKANVPRLETVRPDVPAALADIAERALHRDVAQRYQTAQQMQVDLEQFLRQPGQSATSASLGDWLIAVMSQSSEHHEARAGAFTPTAQHTPATHPGTREPTLPTVPTTSLRAGARHPGPPVLLVGGSGAGLADCARRLEASGTRFEARTALGELPAEGTHQLVIAHYDGLSPDERTRLVRAFSGLKTATRLLLVTEGQARKDLVRLFGQQTLTNLIGRAGAVDGPEFDLTVSKLLEPDVFGIERHLGPDAELQTLTLSGSADKGRALDELEAFATRHGVPARVRGVLLSVAEEMLTNAIFDSPVDAEGVHRFASLSRANEVSLLPGEDIEMTLAFDGRRVGLSVADPFGTLDRQTVLGYLAKCFRRGDDQVDDKPGGAGLGLYFLFESLSTLAINLCPERRTELIGLFDLRPGPREAALATRSFNLFTCEP